MRKKEFVCLCSVEKVLESVEVSCLLFYFVRAKWRPWPWLEGRHKHYYQLSLLSLQTEKHPASGPGQARNTRVAYSRHLSIKRKYLNASGHQERIGQGNEIVKYFYLS